MSCRAFPSALPSLISSFTPHLALRRSLRPHQQFILFRMATTLPKLPIFEAIAKHDPKSPAVIHSSSKRTFTYGSLLHDVAATKDHLSEVTHGKSLRGERIAFLAENGYDYVVTFLAILAHNAIALPLSQAFPSSELRYILENSEAALLLSTAKFKEKAADVLQEEISHKPQLEVLEKIDTGATSAENVKLEHETSADVGGFMLYTSGTTSRPKGVVLSSSVITAQARSLIQAWKYTSSDLLLHILPLHHIHGTVNALFTPLIAGSSIEFLYPFNTDSVWKRLAAPFLPSNSGEPQPITFFTAVPTIWTRLLDAHPDLDEEVRTASRKAISPENLRLNISGSAALPTPTKRAWADLSGGNILLERYGMTEVGMALSCGLDNADRVDGSVGWPLPSVEARLVDTETGRVILAGDELDADGKPRDGEIQLRGPTVFKEYWRNPKATSEEFVDDTDGQGKWFRTGDVAMRQAVDGAGQSDQDWAKGPLYFIKGRASADIIKTGGEKVSALEIERELLALPQVAEAAVIGVPSEKWGQKVTAICVLKKGQELTPLNMRKALKERLVGYKVPQALKVVQQIPRNAMGKINKKSLVMELFPDAT